MKTLADHLVRLTDKEWEYIPDKINGYVFTMYTVRGRSHRLDGPAIEHSSNLYSCYYLDNRQYTAHAWAKAILQHRLLPSHDDAVVDYLRPILQKQAIDLI